MKSINNIVINRENIKHKTPRAEILDYFYDKVSPFWNKGKLTKAYFGIKTSHLKLPDLYYLKSVCDDAERFGKDFHITFWSRLKL